MLLSVLGVGIKLNAAKELVQVVGRRKELKANLLLLQSRLGDESKVAWIDNAKYDMKLRQDKIVEMELASSLSYSSMECEAIDIGTAMFAAFESTSSSEGVKQMEHSAAMDRVETKVDRRSGHLLVRATADVCATAQEIAAHALTYCDSRFGQQTSALDPNIVHAESIIVHGCHTVTFFRFKAPGMWPATGSSGSTSPLKRAPALASMMVCSGLPKAADTSEVSTSWRKTEAGPGGSQAGPHLSTKSASWTAMPRHGIASCGRSEIAHARPSTGHFSSCG